MMYPSLNPLCFFIHPGSPSDAKLYDEILQELKRHRLARNGNQVVFDKCYFSYTNYIKGIAHYKIAQGIFPQTNTPWEKILANFTYPL